MKQLDVDVSPSANIMTSMLTMTHVTFIRVSDLRSLRILSQLLSIGFYFLLFLVQSGRTDRQKAMHMSPPCNVMPQWFHVTIRTILLQNFSQPNFENIFLLSYAGHSVWEGARHGDYGSFRFQMSHKKIPNGESLHAKILPDH